MVTTVIFGKDRATCAHGLFDLAFDIARSVHQRGSNVCVRCRTSSEQASSRDGVFR